MIEMTGVKRRLHLYIICSPSPTSDKVIILYIIGISLLLGGRVAIDALFNITYR
jgi:hypothetical protein